ncbi:MAG: cytochrome c-type biogenesis protein CcmH [Chloroflexota bacterium]|nr:cytochrome c-type biogenesis protein CcmH [Chloroflexota bacterium]
MAWLLAFLMLWAFTPHLAAAQETDPGVTLDDVNTIAEKLYCPVCPNETLDSCRTTACAQWREEIRVQLVAGRSEEQIIADFVARYGERVVDTPLNATLRGLALYTPYVLLVLAAGVAVFTLARWRRGGERTRHASSLQTPPSVVGTTHVSSVNASSANPSSAPSPQTTLSQGEGKNDDDYRARLERDLKG